MTYSPPPLDPTFTKSSPLRSHSSTHLKLISVLLLLTILPTFILTLPTTLIIKRDPKSFSPQSSTPPLIIYPKPRKTGSTLISSMLGTAVLQSGGRVAPCQIASSFTPHSPYYGLVRGFDLLGCHLSLSKINIPTLLSIPREVVFVTSIREPVSWFLSAAVWVYEKKTNALVDSKPLLRKAIDHALDPNSTDFRSFRRLFLSNYGLDESATNATIAAQIGIYSYVFDHATAEQDVNQALLQLGYRYARPSSRREGVYDAEWYEGYRKAEIEASTRLEADLYAQLRKIRDARTLPPASWASLNSQVKVVYSAIPWRGRKQLQASRVSVKAMNRSRQ